jgi:hypothetical protein
LPKKGWAYLLVVLVPREGQDFGNYPCEKLNKTVENLLAILDTPKQVRKHCHQAYFFGDVVLTNFIQK